MTSLIRYAVIALLGFAGLSALPVFAEERAQVAADAVDWRAQPVRLMMIEQAGCIYCAAWDREIGPGFPKSSEGRAAPLLRVNIDGPWPDGIVLDRRPTITPTFILLRDGIELARLEGYPGDEYFYPLIDEMLSDAGIGQAGG